MEPVRAVDVEPRMPDAAGFELQTLSALRALLVAGRLWSVGAPLDQEAVARARESALLGNHRRYLAGIPAYAALAGEHGLGPHATLDDLRAGMVVTDEIFKGYDPGWLVDDLPALTRWLATISTVPVAGLEPAATSLDAWRAELKGHGIFVTFSSGTAGPPSLIPRDRPTLAALRCSSGVRLPWAPRAGTYDCLLTTPAGLGQGIQSGAAGLTGGAVGTHYLPPAPDAQDAHAATAFLQAVVAAHRPVIVYGTPSGLRLLLDKVATPAGTLRLPPGSCVVTGGGWKRGAPQDLAALFEAAGQQLGVPRDRCMDTYSSAELNTVFVSCAEGRYHVPPVVEAVVLDDLLQPIQDDEPEGRLAVLDPFAHSYPGFVAAGDAVRLRRDPCGCGLAGPTLLGPIVRATGTPVRGCGAVEAPNQ